MNCDLCEKKVDERQMNLIENKYFICDNCDLYYDDNEIIENLENKIGEKK